jgi:hypothetical protein
MAQLQRSAAWCYVTRELMGAMLTRGLPRVGMRNPNMPFREDA